MNKQSKETILQNSPKTQDEESSFEKADQLEPSHNLCTEPSKSQTKAFGFAIIASASFGVGNELYSLVSSKHGSLAAYSQCYIQFGFWAIYHLYLYVTFASKEENKGKSYFTKANSSYYERVVNDEDFNSTQGSDNDYVRVTGS